MPRTRPRLLALLLTGAFLTSSPALGAVPAPPPEVSPAPLYSAPLVPEPLSANTALPPLPSIPAHAWLVADANTGEILASQGADEQYAPASTLKILTALTVLDEVPLTEPILVSPNAAHTEGSSVGLYENQSYPTQELLEGMITVSGNDAANALGESRPDMLERMNKKATDLGALDTHAMTFSGLDAPGQVTTAHDLAVLFRAALEDPFYATTSASAQVEFIRHDGVGVALTPHGNFVGAYPGALGGKTGYTNAARASFVGGAERDGVRLIAVVLRSEPKSSAHTMSLLDWGFAVHGSVEPVGMLKGGPHQPVSVEAADAYTSLAADRMRPLLPEPLIMEAKEVDDPTVPTHFPKYTVSLLVALLMMVVLAGSISWWVRRR